MDIERCEEIIEKLEKVLNGLLLRGNKVVKDDVYLEMILTHLSGQGINKKKN